MTRMVLAGVFCVLLLNARVSFGRNCNSERECYNTEIIETNGDITCSGTESCALSTLQCRRMGGGGVCTITCSGVDSCVGATFRGDTNSEGVEVECTSTVGTCANSSGK